MNWQLLARANTHPLRVSILEVLSLDGGRTLSPKDLSLELQAPLSTVNYHVTELAKADLIEMVGEQQVRGAIEHFYRAGRHRRSAKAASKGPRRNGSRRTGTNRREESGRRGSNPRPRAWEARALPAELRPRSGRFYGPGRRSARGLTFLARERPRLRRLPRRPRRRRPARLRPAEQGRGEDRARRAGSRPRAAGPRRRGRRLDRRLPRALGAGQPLGLVVRSRAGRRRRSWSASRGAFASVA